MKIYVLTSIGNQKFTPLVVQASSLDAFLSYVDKHELRVEEYIDFNNPLDVSNGIEREIDIIGVVVSVEKTEHFEKKTYYSLFEYDTIDKAD